MKSLTKASLKDLKYTQAFTSTPPESFWDEKKIKEMYEVKSYSTPKGKLDLSNIRELQKGAFNFVKSKFPKKKVLFLFSNTFAYDDLAKLNYGEVGAPVTTLKWLSDANYKKITGKAPRQSAFNKLSFWEFADAVIYRLGES
ncbi:MAG TPA: hypothetical protein VEA58_14265 [Anaerovoracaceae bacterium]|nr:hypothetical protein [Anaerovoracaceae bacterium]